MLKKDDMKDTHPVYVYGAGGHARVVADALKDMGLTVVGQFNDNREKEHPASVNVASGIRITGPNDFSPLRGPLVIAVGNNLERFELVAMLEDKVSEYVTAIHRSAVLAETATIGEGTVVLHRAVIQPNTTIGRHVLVNTAASIDHDNDLGDFVHISPHATLCGHVEVGEGSHVGAGATIIPCKKVGKWSVVGAGAVVIADIPDYSLAIGVPAKVTPLDKARMEKMLDFS